MNNLPLQAYFDILDATVSIYHKMVDDEVVEESSLMINIRAQQGTPIYLEDGRALDTLPFSIITKGSARPQLDNGTDSHCIGILTHIYIAGQGSPRIFGNFASNLGSLTSQLLIAKAKGTLLMSILNDASETGQSIVWKQGSANSLQIVSLSFQFST